MKLYCSGTQAGSPPCLQRNMQLGSCSFLSSLLLDERGKKKETQSICVSYDFNASQPAYLAVSPSSASMRISWLYFATRSERAGAPVLICPVLSATARSAMVVSSVSPER